MSRVTLALVPALALALALALLSSAWAGAPAFPLEAVRPGLVGFGLTEGPEGIERFDVEILARQDGFGLGFPLVLVRASGPVIDAGGGVSAGMSGSPVVVPHEGGDALLGAIGYVFVDAPGGLALVTPIDVMRAQTAAAAGAAPGTWSALARLGVTPIATPLLLSGLGERARALLQRELLDRAAWPVQAVSGGGSGTALPAAIEPGSAIAVAWVRGDVDVGAVGTVTEITQQRLLAFGHPLLGVGPVDWPLLAAEVTAIVPRRTVPFKLANTGQLVLGGIEQDRPAGVSARLGATPELLPVTLTVAGDTPGGGPTTTLRFEVVRDASLWPTLVAVATLEALDRVRERAGAGTATVHWDVALRDGPGLRISETVVDELDVATAAARLVRAPLVLLAENPFREPSVSSLNLLIRLEEQRRDIEVRQVAADPEPTVAGAVSPLYLRLQPWRRAGEVRVLDVRWPADLSGRVEVVVRGATAPREPDADEPPDPDEAPLTFDELLVFLRERPGGGDLVVEARAEGGEWRLLERLALPGFVTGRAQLALDVMPPEKAGADPDVGSEEHEEAP